VDNVNGFACNCHAGFSGVLCQTNINECASNPCLAPGTSSCSDNVNGFTCNCVAGYSDVLCQTEINVRVEPVVPSRHQQLHGQRQRLHVQLQARLERRALPDW
jgi:hypothetical protein